MKKLLAIICILQISVVSNGQQKGMKINLDYSLTTSMFVSGSLGSCSTAATYWMMEPMSGTYFDQGFLVFTLHRVEGRDNRAYDLLDSVEEAHNYLNLDSSQINWRGDDEKKTIAFLRANYFSLLRKLKRHVWLHVEGEALKTGVSKKAYLTYEGGVAEDMAAARQDSIRRVHWMPRIENGSENHKKLLLGKEFGYKIWNDFADRVEKFASSIHLTYVWPYWEGPDGVCIALYSKEEVDVTFLLLEAEQTNILSQLNQLIKL